MKKVISLVLAAVMLLSVFAVLPTASAAETVYKAGTEIQMLWKFPNIDAFSAIQFILYYGESLEYVKGSAAFPHVTTGSYCNDKIANEINFNASDVSAPYDLSADHIMCQANFIVKEDTTDLGFASEIEELYIRNYEATTWDDMFIDLDRTNEYEVIIVSAPTEPEPKTVYFVNSADWANVNAYVWNSTTNENTAPWPGGVASKTDMTDPNGKDVYSYTFTGDFDKVIFNNNAGTQTDDLDVNENKYYYLPEGVWYDSLDAIPVITEGTTAPPVVSLMGISDWETGTEMTGADGVYTTTVELAEGTYEFKVKVNDTWYGNDGTIVDTTATSSEIGWDMFDGAVNCKLQATGGTYTFSFDTTTNKLIVLAEIKEEPTEEPSEEPTEDTTPSEELKNGIYEEDGKLYYYKDGAKYYAGLILIDGDYYYVNSSGIVITGKKYSISKTNYLLPRDVYEFDEEGKMINPPVKETTEATEAPAVKNGIFEEDGVLYYYKDGAKYYGGLIMIGEDYYYVNSSCKVIIGKSYYVSKTNNLLPSASYTFDLDGKMLNPPVEETTESSEITGVKNGFVVENGVTYYYVDDVKTYAGLIEIDGDLYYVNSSYKVIMGKSYYVSKTNGLKDRGSYTFDATGKLVG